MSHCAARVGNRVIALGGIGGFGGYNSITEATDEAFDLVERKWTDLPERRPLRYTSAVAVVGNRVFIFGSMDLDWDSTPECAVFNAKADVWEPSESVPKMRISRHVFGVATVGHCIYIIGGAQRHSYTCSVDVLDTEINAWRSLTPLPAPRYGMAVAVVGDREIWLFGGEDARYHNATKEILIYDIHKDVWTVSELKLPTARHGASAMVVDEKIFVMGGGKTQIDVLDLKLREWFELPPMLTSRVYYAVTTL
jgi:N-acetylneuraminic acid mutarotase